MEEGFTQRREDAKGEVVGKVRSMEFLKTLRLSVLSEAGVRIMDLRPEGQLQKGNGTVLVLPELREGAPASATRFWLIRDLLLMRDTRESKSVAIESLAPVSGNSTHESGSFWRGRHAISVCQLPEHFARWRILPS